MKKEGFRIQASNFGKEESTADSRQPTADSQQPTANRFLLQAKTVDCRLRDVATAADRTESLRTEPLRK